MKYLRASGLKYLHASIRSLAALFLIGTVTGLIPLGTPVSGFRDAVAQDLTEGVWQALMLSPRGEIERPLYHVEHSGGTIKAFVEWRTGKIEVQDLNLKQGRLSFTWNPYFPMICRFEHAEEGQYKGSCMDENGGIGPAVLSPPGVDVEQEDVDETLAYGVWGLTKEEYERLRRGPMTAAEELRMLADELVPTQTLSVDGRSVNVASAGAGDVTVVFESGFGDDHTVWEQVQSEVASFARTFSYDRAGIGSSESASTPRTPDYLAGALREILKASGHASPYVLVGHGSGAFTLRAFAEQYPDDVAGLVLVNPAHEGDDEALRELDESSWQKFVNQKRSFLEVVSEAARREFDAYLKTLDTWDERSTPRLPGVRSVVLAAGQPAEAPEWVGETADGIQARIKLQRALAEDLGAAFRRVDGSTDLIHMEDPSKVVDAIRAVLGSVEKVP